VKRMLGGLLAVVLLAGLLLGCPAYEAPQDVPPVRPENPIMPGADANLDDDFSVGTSRLIDAQMQLTVAYSPAFLSVSGAYGGTIADTWTRAGNAKIGNALIPYCKGERLFIVLYNGYDTPTDFVLSFQRTYIANDCKAAGNDIIYSPTPEGIQLRVILPSSPITVPPKYAYKAPISLSLPEDVGYPENWEFIVRVDDSKAGNFAAAHGIRVLISMR